MAGSRPQSPVAIDVEFTSMCIRGTYTLRTYTSWGDPLMFKRLITLVAFATAALLVSPQAAFAAPGNTASDPIDVTATLPVTVVTDTTTADSDPTDPADLCYGRQPSFTEFYTFTPTQNTFVNFTSDEYAGFISVYRMTEGGLEGYACDSAHLSADSGTYLIMVSTRPVWDETIWDYVPGTSGGHGTLSFTAAPPDLEVQVTVTATLVNQRTGVARLYVTVSCNTPTDYNLNGSLRQRVSGTAAAVTHAFDYWRHCGETGTDSFEIVADPGSGAFSVGSARLVLNVGAHNGYTGDSVSLDNTVRLKATRL